MAEDILIVQAAPEVARMLEALLEDGGFAARTVAAPLERAVDEVRTQEPDALVLGLPPHAEAAGRVLDALRTDPVARAVPVLAMATVPRVADDAVASYTVQETLEQPFDIDDAVACVERTLAHPPIQAAVGPATQDGPLARAEPVLAERSRVVLLERAARLRREEEAPRHPEAPTAEVLRGTVAVVDAIDASLRLAHPAALFDRPEVVERIAEAARARRSGGVDLDGAHGGLLELGDDLWAALASGLPADLGAADVAAARRAFDEVVERVVALTVPVYAEGPPRN